MSLLNKMKNISNKIQISKKNSKELKNMKGGKKPRNVRHWEFQKNQNIMDLLGKDKTQRRGRRGRQVKSENAIEEDIRIQRHFREKKEREKAMKKNRNLNIKQFQFDPSDFFESPENISTKVHIENNNSVPAFIPIKNVKNKQKREFNFDSLRAERGETPLAQKLIQADEAIQFEKQRPTKFEPKLIELGMQQPGDFLKERLGKNILKAENIALINKLGQSGNNISKSTKQVNDNLVQILREVQRRSGKSITLPDEVKEIYQKEAAMEAMNFLKQQKHGIEDEHELLEKLTKKNNDLYKVKLENEILKRQMQNSNLENKMLKKNSSSKGVGIDILQKELSKLENTVDGQIDLLNYREKESLITKQDVDDELHKKQKVINNINKLNISSKFSGDDKYILKQEISDIIEQPTLKEKMMQGGGVLNRDVNLKTKKAAKRYKIQNITKYETEKELLEAIQLLKIYKKNKQLFKKRSELNVIAHNLDLDITQYKNAKSLKEAINKIL